MSSDCAGTACSFSNAPTERAASDLDFWSRHGAAIAWGFVALGVAVRVVRYLLRFPLWGDEMMLAENLLTRDYAGLMRGLDHWQVAPVGYLWAQKAVIDVLGFNEYSLRAIALVGGVAGLVLFRIAAGYVLRGLPLVLAVAFLSVAYYPIRHAAEVKPYAVDLLAAVLLLEPLLAWLRDPARTAALWRLVPAAIFATMFSFPAVFVGGAVSLALGYEAWRRQARSALVPWLIYNVALVGTFAIVFFAVMRNHYSAHGATMTNYWETGFPPSLAQPIEWLKWMAAAHTGETLAYPVGGDGGGSTLQLLLAIVGGMVLWRARNRGLIIIVAATAGLGLLAAVLHRYPYGHGERLQQYWAPLLCLLIGQGAAAALLALRSDFVRKHAARGAVIASAVIGVGIMVRDVQRPYKIYHDARHREFSREFWSQAATGEPTFDLEEDLHMTVFDSFEALPYRINKHIYDCRSTAWEDEIEADGIATTAERIEALPEDRPIRCVAFARHDAVPQPTRYAEWLAEMSKTHRLVGEQCFPMQIEVTGERATYHVWRFEPRTPVQTAQPANPSPRR